MKRILNKKYNLDNGIIRYFLLIIIALLVIAIFLTIFCCSNNEGNTSWWCSHLATTIIFITAITALLVQKSLKENIQKIIAPTLLMIALIGVSAAICNSPQNPSLYAMSVTMSAPALLFFIREKRKIVRFTALCLFIICFFLRRKVQFSNRLHCYGYIHFFHITDFHKNTNKVVCLDCIYNNYVRYRYLVFYKSRFFIGKKIHSRKKHRHDS